MEKSRVTSNEEGKASEKQLQVNVDLLLWSEGNCSQRICSSCQKVNAAFYIEVLKHLQENVQRKLPDQWRNNTWLLHHDNAPAHAVLLTRRFLTDNNMIVVPHPPYSPDLAPRDFLFPELKMKLKGRRFQTLEEIQAEVQAVLNMLRENDLNECFKNWQRCWDLCHASEGDYFEGDAGP